MNSSTEEYPAISAYAVAFARSSLSILTFDPYMIEPYGMFRNHVYSLGARASLPIISGRGDTPNSSRTATVRS